MLLNILSVVAGFIIFLLGLIVTDSAKFYDDYALLVGIILIIVGVVLLSLGVFQVF